MDEVIKNVAVVGGGSAGWLTALFLQKNYPNLDITVIEDPDSLPIIAGESCTSPFVNLLEFLGIDFLKWISYVKAIPKLGGKFINWNGNNDFYIQPQFSTYLNKWLFDHPELGDNNDFLKGMIALELPIYKTAISGILIERNLTPLTADSLAVSPMYHFDSRKNADFFKTEGLNREIKLLESKLLSCEFDKFGISKLNFENFSKTYDFYFDCTGFQQKILRKSLGVEFKNYERYIPTNSVLAWWDDSDHYPYTEITSMNNGWRFNVSLSGRSGNGYVYDNNFASPDDIKKEIEIAIGKEIEPIAKLTWENSVTETPWVNNVLAIGLSSGFLEPLGSPGHTLIALQLKLLSEHWDLNMFSENCRKVYNAEYQKLLDDTIDFILTHYQCKRNDTDFWKAHQHGEYVKTDSLQEKLENWKNSYFDKINMSTYSLENYSVLIQHYSLTNNKQLIKLLNNKNSNILKYVKEEYERLNVIANTVANNCLDYTHWKKLYD